MENKIKTVIITGANSGLGYRTAKKIAKTSKNFRIILACRNLEKGNKAKEEIIKETGNENIIVMEIDTSSLNSVRNFVKNYKETLYGKIYCLVCNAGISGMHSGITKDGFDIIFETNHLGHFLLTNSLISLMEENGKIFIVSSDMHNPPEDNFKWIGTEKIAKPDSSFQKDRKRYSYSKLCNLYFTYELNKKLIKENKKLYVNAFNPGFMQNPNFAVIKPELVKFITEKWPDRIGDLEKSSQALADLVTIEDFNVTGAYYDRNTIPSKSSELSYDENNSKELWDMSELYVKE